MPYIWVCVKTLPSNEILSGLLIDDLRSKRLIALDYFFYFYKLSIDWRVIIADFVEYIYWQISNDNFYNLSNPAILPTLDCGR